jgi:hypothetical protein
VQFCKNYICLWLESSQQRESEQITIPDHGCRRYRSFLPFRRNSLLEALSRLRRAPAFPFPVSLWLKWPLTWRSRVVCNIYHRSSHITTYRPSFMQRLKVWTCACHDVKFYEVPNFHNQWSEGLNYYQKAVKSVHFCKKFLKSFQFSQATIWGFQLPQATLKRAEFH